MAMDLNAYEGKVAEESLRLHTRFHHVFWCPNTIRMHRHCDSLLATACNGRSVLSVGCWSGDELQELVRYSPARVVGIDISETAICEARAKWGTKAQFHAMDVHRMSFADDSFDVVFGRAILHHLDLETALREIRRVLKPGGWAIFEEPLADNPAGKILRWLTPKARTLEEQPLSRTQIAHADAEFGAARHFYANLVSVPLAMATSLTPLRANNVILRAADQVDRLLALTPLRHWMRYAALCWQK